MKIFTLPLALLLCGCASVSVYDVGQNRANAPTRTPQKIFVREFSTPDTAFRVDRQGAELAEFQATIRRQLAEAIALRLTERVAPAEVLPLHAPAPKGNFWLVEGRFDQVIQGSRLLRAGVGFGAGASRMDTTSFLLRLDGPAPARMLVVRTTGGSGAEPGAIAGFDPIGIAVNAASGAQKGLSSDTTRTAREIVATINEFAHQHNLIPDKKRLQPKRLGQLPAGMTPWQG